MCGILVHFGNNHSSVAFKNALISMRHRGPDGYGIKEFAINDSILRLGHNRLSILELTELGSQPMNYLDLEIVFNGEIYNFKELQAELIHLGHSFTSNSDTEVILHAYKEWGLSSVNRFIGMFAFVIYDKSQQKLIVVRDRVGVKPLFLFQKNDELILCSELKAISNFKKNELRIDNDSVRAYLKFGYVPTNYCIFENILKVSPGTYLEIELNRSEFSESIKSTQYWDSLEYYLKPKLEIPYEEIKLQTKALIRSASQFRMVSDVPVGVFLSGGYDSTLVTSILQKELDYKLNTYTIGVENVGLDESKYAAEISNYLGTNHTSLICTEAEAIRMNDDIPFHYDEPFADSSAIPTMLVSQLARKDVTVSLSADGGDELFGGYNRYSIVQKMEFLHKIPVGLRRIAASLLSSLPSSVVKQMGKRNPLFFQRYDKIIRVLKNSSPEEFLSQLSQFFTFAELNELLKECGLDLVTNFDIVLPNSMSPLNKVQYLDIKTYLLDDILQKVDRATMAFSLEGREPLLDHRLIEWAAQIPDEFKIRKGDKKWIIKDIVHDYIPKTMMDRPKMGFAVPIEDWMATAFKKEIDYLLSKEYIINQGVFNYESVEFIKKSFYSGKKEFGNRLWYIYQFQKWYEQWMKN